MTTLEPAAGAGAGSCGASGVVVVAEVDAVAETVLPTDNGLLLLRDVAAGTPAHHRPAFETSRIPRSDAWLPKRARAYGCGEAQSAQVCRPLVCSAT